MDTVTYWQITGLILTYLLVRSALESRTKRKETDRLLKVFREALSTIKPDIGDNWKGPYNG